MKKSILILVTLSLILSLFSCTTPTETTPPSDEIEETVEPKYTDESPFDFILTRVEKVLYKVYPEEGVLIPACPDPLCKHNSSSCCFTNMETIRIDENMLYYLRTYDARGMFCNQICTYDFSSDEYNVLYKHENSNESIINMIKADKYLFYNIYNPYGEAETRRFTLVRYEIGSGNIVTLADKLPDSVLPLAVESDRIFWRDGTGYYSTDFDYKNKVENDMGYDSGYVTGGYAFPMSLTGRVIKNGDQGSAFLEGRVSRINLETKEESVFIESAGTFPIAYKGKVIYTPIEDAVFLGKKFSGGEETSVYNKYGNKLYICNADGSENRLLCEIKENNFEFLRAFPGVAGVFGMGDYIIHKLICYRPMKNKQQYIEKDQEKILVVNIVTGDYKILSAE